MVFSKPIIMGIKEISLKEYISFTIKEIAEGLKNVQQPKDSSKGAINTGGRTLEKSNIEMEVSLTITKETTHEGGFSISVFNYSGERGNELSTCNKVKFNVPISLNRININNL